MAFEEHHAFLFPLGLRPSEIVIKERIGHARYRALVDYYEKELLLKGDRVDVENASRVGQRRKRNDRDVSDFDLLRMAFRDSRLCPQISDDSRFLTCDRRYRQITSRNDRRYFCDQIQGLRRLIRDYLFESCSHLDIVNCHYSLIMGFVKRMYPDDASKFTYLDEYLANRSRFISDLRLFTADRCTPEQCKQLIASFLMGGSLTSWASRLPCQYHEVPISIRTLHSVVGELRSFVSSKPELNRFRPASYSRMDSFECTNTMLYMLLTTLESQHIIVLRKTLLEQFDVEVRAIIHDAVEIDGVYQGSEVDGSSEFLTRLRPHLRDAGFYDEVKLAFKSKQDSVDTIERMLTEQVSAVASVVVPEIFEKPLSVRLSNVPSACLNPTYLRMKTNLETDFGLCRVLTMYYMKTRDMEGFLSFNTDGYDPKEMKTILENYRVRINEKKEEPFFSVWTKDPSMKTYSHAVLYPSEACPIQDALNLWNGFAVERFSITDTDRKSAENIALKEHYFRHLRYLVDDDAHASYWMVFLAHLFQHPDQKPGICMVLQSDTEGVGKGLFESILRCMVGEDLSWYTNTPEDNLFGSFQDIMHHAILGVIDESNVTKNKSVEKFKALITNESISLTRKYHGARTVRDFHRFILTTNQTMPSVVSATDRRFMISRTKNAAIDPESIQKLVLIKQSRVIMRMIYEDFMRMEIPLDFKFSTARPSSDFYREIQTLSRPTTLLFFDSWLSERLSSVLNANPASSVHFVAPPGNAASNSVRFLNKLPRPSNLRVSSKEFYEEYTEFIKKSGFKTECTLSVSRFGADMRNHLGASMDAEQMEHGVWYHKVFSRADPTYYQKHVWDFELNEMISFMIETGALKSNEYQSIINYSA